MFYRVGNASGGLDVEERREGAGLKLTYLLSWPSCYSCRCVQRLLGDYVLDLGNRKPVSMGREVEREDLYVWMEIWEEEIRKHQQVVCLAEMRMKLEDLF